MFSIAFAAASLLCGLAGAPAELVGARLRGAGRRGHGAQVLAMITAMFQAGERPRALAWLGVTAGASGLCGQVLGGVNLCP